MAERPAETELMPEGPELNGQLDALERRFDDLEKQSQRLQRLAAMGTMSAMLAHEFMNLLTPIISYAQYALSKPDPELMQKALDTTLKNARSAATLCDRVMNMASAEERPAESCQLRQIVDDALAALGRNVERDGIRLETEVDESIHVCFGAVELQQVLFNLILNARQAMLDRPGSLRISAGRADGGRVTLNVSDAGTGIRSEDLPRVFDPFFTTKRRADRADRRGLGLGLTICRQLLENGGGNIRVTSKWGQGTTFTLDLPEATVAEA